MGRSPSYSSKDCNAFNRGAWSAKEDMILREYVANHGKGRWSSIPIKAGLNRSGKSCRLRWMNYLRPQIKRGNISADEEELIIRLHGLLGNRWSLIAGRLSGRTDNEIKNHWNTKLSKKCLSQKEALPSDNNKLDTSHPQHRVLKAAPIKTKAVKLSRCPSRDNKDLNFPAADRNMKHSELSKEKILAENEFGMHRSSPRLEFPSTENSDQFSPLLMPNLVESTSLPCKHGKENESVASQSLLNFNQLQNVDFDILSYQSYYDLDNLRGEEWPGYSSEQGTERICSSSQLYDWLNQFQYI